MRSGHDARGGLFQGRPFRVATVLLLPGFVLRLVFVGLLVPSPAFASSLLAGTAGSADSATSGANIAEPLSPLGAQFNNPAGLAGFTERAMGASLGLAYGRGVVTADDPAGYHAENEVLVPFLDTTLVVPWGRWTFGMSSMGTSGARFDYGARPELGVNDGFFSESGILGVAIGGAYRVSDSLWLGAQIIPLYATTHLRFSREVAESPGVQTPFRFTVGGFGVQGMFGVTWKPDENWSLGLSLRPPGRIWTSGDSKYAGGKQDVDLELEAPLEVSLGITRRLATAWKVSYGIRFTDSSTLGTSYLRYEETPSANSPFVHDARDEWRHAVGVQYAWSESLQLLGGVTKANGIVGSKGTNPASYDSRDWRLNTGLSWKGERWGIDASFGYIFADARRVSVEDALVFPGKYDSKPAYLLSVTVLKKF